MESSLYNTIRLTSEPQLFSLAKNNLIKKISKINKILALIIVFFSIVFLNLKKKD